MTTQDQEKHEQSELERLRLRNETLESQLETLKTEYIEARR